MRTRRTPRSFAWILSFAFLLTQAMAIAHEVEHDLYQHDEPCALHDLVDHSGKSLAAHLALPVSSFIDVTPIAAASYGKISHSPPLYSARAPPAGILS